MVERFTRTGPGALVYELSYSDPEVFTAPWTARITWTRDDSYEFFEYACNEGNQAIRNNILATRAARRQAAGARTHEAQRGSADLPPLARARSPAGPSGRTRTGRAGIAAPGRSRKGASSAGEDPATASRREAMEELGVTLDGKLAPLGDIRQAGGKRVTAVRRPTHDLRSAR